MDTQHMKILFQNKEYLVRFKYLYDSKYPKPRQFKKIKAFLTEDCKQPCEVFVTINNKFHLITTCEIYLKNIDEYQLVSKGESIKCRKDKMEKTYGKVLAFARAVNQIRGDRKIHSGTSENGLFAKALWDGAKTNFGERFQKILEEHKKELHTSLKQK